VYRIGILAQMDVIAAISNKAIRAAPPLAQDRGHLRADGRVLVALNTVWESAT
jgi:hypothetical protein